MGRRWGPVTPRRARTWSVYGRGSIQNRRQEPVHCGVLARATFDVGGAARWTCRLCDRDLGERERRPWASKVRRRAP